MANISDVKAQMIGGCARPNQCRVVLFFPNCATAGTFVRFNAHFLSKAAQLLQSTVDNTHNCDR